MSRTYRNHQEHDAYLIKENRFGKDYKPGFKPKKFYKKIRQDKFKAEEKEALINGKEFPLNKKVDIWNWN